MWQRACTESSAGAIGRTSRKLYMVHEESYEYIPCGSQVYIMIKLFLTLTTTPFKRKLQFSLSAIFFMS